MRRISRELHDGTCQALMAIKMDLGVLEQCDDAFRGVAAGLGDKVVWVHISQRLLPAPAEFKCKPVAKSTAWPRVWSPAPTLWVALSRLFLLAFGFWHSFDLRHLGFVIIISFPK